MGESTLYSFHRNSENLPERGCRKIAITGVIDDFRETVFTIPNRAVAHLNSQQLRQHAQDRHKLQADKNPSLEEVGGHKGHF